MPWPDYTPAPNRPTARMLLTQIINRSSGWLATLPPDVNPPEPADRPGVPATQRQRWQRIWEDARMDRDNVDHPNLRSKVDPDGNAVGGGTLESPWNDVRDCWVKVNPAAPSMEDLAYAIGYIDHIGVGGLDYASVVTIEPPAQVVTGRWPDVAFGDPLVTARRYLDAIRAHVVGQLLQDGLSAALQKAHVKLLIDVVLDRANVAHGNLRKFVKPDGTGVTKASPKAAWGHVRKALELLNATTVGVPQVAAAYKLVRHEV